MQFDDRPLYYNLNKCELSRCVCVCVFLRVILLLVFYSYAMHFVLFWFYCVYCRSI